jgi:hypothetical protein
MKQIMVRILYQIRDEGGRAYNKSFVYFMNEHMNKIHSDSDVYQLLLLATDGDEVNNASRWLHGIDHFQEVFRVLFYQEDIRTIINSTLARLSYLAASYLENPQLPLLFPNNHWNDERSIGKFTIEAKLCMLQNTRRPIGMDCEEDALPFPVLSGRCHPTEFVLPNRHESNERSVDDPLTGFSQSHILFRLGREGTTVPTLTEVVSYYVPYNNRN